MRSPTLQFYASYAFVDAHFLNALQIGFNSPFADNDGNIQVLPGNQIPTILSHRIKAAIDDAMMELDACANQIEISRCRNARPDREEIDEGELHEVARIVSTI